MVDTEQTQLIKDLSRDMVSEIVPQELPMFRAQSEAFFQDSGMANKKQATKDDMLGFGVDSAATFLTPAILSVASVVVNFVVEAVKETFKGESKEFLNEIVKKTFKKLRKVDQMKQQIEDDQPEKVEQPKGEEQPKDLAVPKEESFKLSQEQLKAIRERAIEQALIMRLSEKTAETLANSIVGSLALSSN